MLNVEYRSLERRDICWNQNVSPNIWDTEFFFYPTIVYIITGFTCQCLWTRKLYVLCCLTSIIFCNIRHDNDLFYFFVYTYVSKCYLLLLKIFTQSFTDENLVYPTYRPLSQWRPILSIHLRASQAAFSLHSAFLCNSKESLLFIEVRKTNLDAHEEYFERQP